MPKIRVVESFSNSDSDIEQLHSPLKSIENSPAKQSATSNSDTDKENIFHVRDQDLRHQTSILQVREAVANKDLSMN